MAHDGSILILKAAAPPKLSGSSPGCLAIPPKHRFSIAMSWNLAPRMGGEVVGGLACRCYWFLNRELVASGRFAIGDSRRQMAHD